jgi:hypothetical protein
MARAKGAKVGQELQPYSVRRDGVAAWCDGQSAEDVAAFARAYGSGRRAAGGSGGNLVAAALSPSPPSPLPSPSHPYRGRFSTHELHDAFGPAVADAAYTGITCSEETAEGCAAINAARRAAGLQPMEVIVAPLVMGASGAKLSSTELRAMKGARTG